MNGKIKKKKKYEDQSQKLARKNFEKNFMYVNTEKILS